MVDDAQPVFGDGDRLPYSPLWGHQTLFRLSVLFLRELKVISIHNSEGEKMPSSRAFDRGLCARPRAVIGFEGNLALLNLYLLHL